MPSESELIKLVIKHVYNRGKLFLLHCDNNYCNCQEYKPPAAKDIPQDFRVTLLKNSRNPRGVLGSKGTFYFWQQSYSIIRNVCPSVCKKFLGCCSIQLISLCWFPSIQNIIHLVHASSIQNISNLKRFHHFLLYRYIFICY